MLVRVIKELPEYNNIVVTLYDNNQFGAELQCTRYICLKQRSLLFFPFTALALRKLIRQYHVDIVHTHLFWPTLIARIATPKNVTLITTIHAFIATSVEYKKWFIRFLDKVSYRLHKSVIIGVAKGATAEYFSFLKLKPYRCYSIYTFVDTGQFNHKGIPVKTGHEGFRLISVGALRQQKNHRFLVDAFRLLKNEHIHLHIYGDGPLKTVLQSSIDDAAVNISLKGMVTNIHELLPQYDLFVMSSTFEGFSLGVLETMAMKVPMLLSDIVSFREQCEDTAIYFSLNDVNDFAEKVKALLNDKVKRDQLSENAFKRVINNFTLEHHIKQLKQVYLDNSIIN
jgi:glycosyltransferase involved in cell wall biosynthesis